MWTYFGSKTNVVKFYPPPEYDKIIEPFAGTARYSLKYFDRDVLLVDKYEVVAKIWKWLQKCSVGDIHRLPHHVKPNQSLDDFTFDCIEAKWLLGFLIGFGMERPRKTASEKRMIQRPNHVNYSLNRIAGSLHKIRHWEIVHGSYEDIENQKATWFVDPPYQNGDHVYIESNKNLCYSRLAKWSKSRNGQVIVCESIGADWMDFKPLTSHKGVRGMQKELIWSNVPISYQSHLFTPYNQHLQGTPTAAPSNGVGSRG